MTRSLVLGSGIVGRAAAWDLNRRGHEVIVADADAATCRTVGEELDLPWRQLDVNDTPSVDEAMQEADLVVSGVPYLFGVALTEAAIRNGCHFFDFGGNPTIVQQQLTSHAAAEAAGVAIVPDCGLAPGFANVLAVGLIGGLEAPIDDVQIRVGVLPQHPQGTLQYQLAFYAGGLINEYAEPCEVIVDGKVVTVEPLTRFEDLEWDGLGMLEAFSTAGGTSTMCREYEGRVGNLEYKTIRFPGHGRIFAAMREIGLFDTATLPIGSVAPRELLLELLTRHLPQGGPDRTLVSVVVCGGDRVVEQRLEDLSDEQFSSLARTTAFPTTALCDLVARGIVDFRGVAAMHSVTPVDVLLSELAQVGMRVDSRSSDGP